MLSRSVGRGEVREALAVMMKMKPIVHVSDPAMSKEITEFIHRGMLIADREMDWNKDSVFKIDSLDELLKVLDKTDHTRKLEEHFGNEWRALGEALNEACARHGHPNILPTDEEDGPLN